ncbi:MAG: hypothetical protein QOI93_714, partial [Rhodospirillaceae bacterium]|nr:hypothetical protein [Rhodospirillaceae bacterium]
MSDAIITQVNTATTAPDTMSW